MLIWNHEAQHEEADTRIILDCVENHTYKIVVQCRDTNVIALLLGHYHRMTCIQLWLKTGTAKKRQYIPIHDIVDHMPCNAIPIHDIVDHMPYNADTRESIPAFHSLTGSDTTSYIEGYSKRSAWKTFQTYHHLLENLGKGELTAETSQNAEQFICKLYNINNVSTTNVQE